MNKFIVRPDCVVSFDYLRLGFTSKMEVLKDIYNSLHFHPFNIPESRNINDSEIEELGAYLNYKRNSVEWDVIKQDLEEQKHFPKKYFCFKVND